MSEQNKTHEQERSHDDDDIGIRSRTVPVICLTTVIFFQVNMKYMEHVVQRVLVYNYSLPVIAVSYIAVPLLH